MKPAFSAFSFKTSLKERDVFCYTFRSLTAPSLSLVSAPMKSRLSSPKKFCILSSDCLPSLKKNYAPAKRRRRRLVPAASSEAVSASCQ